MPGDPGTTLPGARLHLRRLSMHDLPRFQAYRGDAELGRWQGWRPMSEEDAAAFLQQMAVAPLFSPGRWCQLAIAEIHNDVLIGDIGMHLSAAADVVEMGFTLRRDLHGRGLASEAVGLATQLVWARSAATRIEAVADERNLASLRLLRRLGFELAAIEHAVFRGEPCVEHRFVMRRAPSGTGPAGAHSRMSA